MGYQVYEVGNRWGGYGVPTICEQPNCTEEIDRGISYACGGEPFSEWGCDRYFCSKHLFYHNFRNSDGGNLYCYRCVKYKNPFPYKPERKEWVQFLLKDKSWANWREENQLEVKKLKHL